MNADTRPAPARPDPWGFLRQFTAARLALGRAGGSLPTAALLDFQLAHARARDAVHASLDEEDLARQLSGHGHEIIHLCSAAQDRQTFIARPDLGRRLDDSSLEALRTLASRMHKPDVAFVLADGLSALALQRHAAPLLEALLPRLSETHWQVAALSVVRQGRVAIGDEIGALLGAALSVVLIGERPGLSSPDSLGVYITWQPTPGRSNAERNCISNIRPEGLGYEAAAHKLFHLMTMSRRLGLSGVELKEDSALENATHAHDQ